MAPPTNQPERKSEASQLSAGGLTQEEARKRLDRYDYNELAEEISSPLRKFLSYFLGADSLDDRGRGDPRPRRLLELWHKSMHLFQR
ncbi:MAG: hypothetical protein JW959_09705 [Pirellulales bacterium]|nr:hypothetical protein [Pirellulales bacterium]